MTLYIMRHGETNYNQLGLCNDDPSKNVYLTETGVEQAEQAAKQLAQVPLTKIYVSELPRTRQTADIINRIHSAPIITSHYLNDICSGFDGKPVEDYFTATGHDRYNTTPPGGESVKEFQMRVLKFLEEIENPKDKSILVVTHEEAMRVFYAYFHNLDPEQMMELHFANCAVVNFTL
ncbi:histidine phosphatase family protein [Kaarinaea lacus]